MASVVQYGTERTKAKALLPASIVLPIAGYYLGNPRERPYHDEVLSGLIWGAAPCSSREVLFREPVLAGACGGILIPVAPNGSPARLCGSV